MPTLFSPVQDVDDFLSSLNADRHRGLFCDFEIRSGETRLPCHRNIVKNRLSTLQSTSSELGSTLECRELVSETSLEAMLQYIYTFEVDVDESNASELLRIARDLGLERLQTFCEEFLSGVDVTETNWFILWRSATELQLKELRESVVAFLVDNFTAVAAQPEFMELDLITLEEVLSSDRLPVGDEREALAAATQWLMHSQEERLSLAGEVLGRVRLAMIDFSPNECESLFSAPYFASGDARQLLESAIKYNHFPSMRWELQSPMTRPRPSTGMQEVLFGVSVDCTVDISHFSERESIWTFASSTLHSSQSRGEKFEWNFKNQGLVAVYDDKMYLVDSVDEEMYCCHTVNNGVWSVFPADFTRRRGAVCVTAGSAIYLIGGYLEEDDGDGQVSSDDSLSVVGDAGSDEERENLQSDHDCDEESLLGTPPTYTPQSASDSSDTEAAPVRRLPEAKSPKEFLCVVERVHLRRAKWEVAPEMPVAVASPCAFYANNKIYVVGGEGCTDGHASRLRHVQVFDCDRQCWTLIEDVLPEPHALLCAACYEGVVYVLSKAGIVYSFDLGTFECQGVVNVGRKRDGATMTVYNRQLVISSRGEYMKSVNLSTKGVRVMKEMITDSQFNVVTLVTSMDCDDS